MNIVIIDYGAGNIQSVEFALARAGVAATLSHQAEVIAAADKVIFPGVGEASTAMARLRAQGLDRVICDLKQPVLGICLGMQLLCAHSAEGDTPCLGIFPEHVQRFEPLATDGSRLKVPQMGWNQLQNPTGTLFQEVPAGSYAYFVHSYYVPLSDYTAAEANYGLRYSAALERGNFYATQFHPEKSADIGARILRAFLEVA